MAPGTTANGVANSKTARWATIGPVVLLVLIGVLLSQINNVAAAIASGVPISG